MAKKASLIIRHKSRFTDKEFDYLAEDTTQIGDIVLVQFGNGNRTYEAVVTSVSDLKDIDQELKPILKKAMDYRIPKKKIDLAMWIRQEYMCSLNEAISLFIPRSGEVLQRTEKFLVPLEDRSVIEKAITQERKNSKNRILLLELLCEGEVNITNLQRDLNKSFLDTARDIADRGIAKLEERRHSRIPKSDYHVRHRPINLSKAQRTALENIKKNIAEKTPTLLYGVTGSGKTEVYIDLIEDCIQRGKQAIMLVPEISLTPQTIGRFKNVFGDKIGVFHSQISAGERKDQNDLILDGEINLVIGARSAIFAPMENLGLIIIDECHDDAYKSEQSPKYDSIKLAQKLCEAYDAGLVIGTATPTVEQYYEAVYGSYDIQELRYREKGLMPTIEIVDTLEEQRMGKMTTVSDSIKFRIKAEIEKGHQVIVFLNKRGYGSTLSCNNCNHTIICPRCDISLTYHKNGDKLMCHYCGHEEKFSKKCLACQTGIYKAHNYGTQKVEAEIKESIENAKIVRLDRDTTSKKGGHEALLNLFKDKKANILVGTQMISKGLDFENVSLVVILNADQGLRFPDYRSSEKTLSMLMQVSGRAGRGEKPGSVIVQTADKDNKIFDYLKNHNYSDFFWDEIKERKAFSYPPYAELIRIMCISHDYKKSAETAEKIKNAIEFYLKKRKMGIITLGPVPNMIHKMDNKYRWQLFYKIQSEKELDLIKSIIMYILSEKRNLIVDKETVVSVDINPKNLI